MDGVVEKDMYMATANKPHGAARFSSDAARWTAVTQRDPEADGAFLYSVRSTGVYCRPTCPARLPRRENVAFHASCEAAEKAGFRPCKRCRPNGLTLAAAHAAAVAKACRVMQTETNPSDLDGLAAAAGMSRFHFHRAFKLVTGITPKAYGEAQRARRVREVLPLSNTVTEAIYNGGFNSGGRFYANSTRVLGMKPAHFRNGGNGEVIRFAVGECSLGSILVAATVKGVCAILLGDDPDLLVRDLQDRFPKADLIGGDAAFEQRVAKVVGFVEAPHRGLDLPLDIRGTVLQQRVWQTLQSIPAGATASYSDIAARTGVPKAVRAVASAIAANPLAVAIPCHRVVRKDGALSGYRWGVERKRTLLEREQGQRRRRLNAG